ncbi:MAG TPA: Fe-S cluster assembly protein SufD [Tepidisphaeraceae bacterium]|nr:Fe-S cluster assembly protein SufD [Tepidisphaeraceae bacterium]
MTQLADTHRIHLSNFARFEQTERRAAGNGHAPRPAWLEALRRAGIERFERVGFPGGRDELWRHTNFSPIAKTPFRLAGRDAVESAAAADVAGRFTFGGEAAAELVFVNGHFAPRLSRIGNDLPRGVYAGSLAEAFSAHGAQVERHLGRHADLDGNPFVALNSGFVADGAYVYFPRGATVEGPIHLLFVSIPDGTGEPMVSHPRVLIVAEDTAEASVVESYAGTEGGAYWTNAVTEMVVGNGAAIDHNKLQQESVEAFHVGAMQVRLGRDGRFVSHNTTTGGRLTRNDLNVLLAGENADATLNGLVVIDGQQHVDNHTLLDHAAPHCPSHELYKHVLGGRATGVFKGKILVRQAAQKTDSKQTSKTLLLSDDAYMNSQPALEIYADDVKCTHGSTTGPVDESMVFYIRQRGVSLDAARHLLTYAFAADVTRRIKVGPVRRRIEDYMAAQHGLPQDLRITDLGAHDEAAR